MKIEQAGNEEEKIMEDEDDVDWHIDELLMKSSRLRKKRNSSSSSSDWSTDSKNDSFTEENYLNEIEDEEVKEKVQNLINFSVFETDT